jgi:hypothetical protein
MNPLDALIVPNINQCSSVNARDGDGFQADEVL